MRQLQRLSVGLFVGLAGTLGCSADDANGGGSGAGGAGAQGGSATSGGTTSGGAVSSGGATSLGGGGTTTSGGTSAKGGAPSTTGGAMATGGTAGAGTASGGKSTSGGVTGSGGTSAGACGATPTGTGAAFTPVASYTAKDGGFGPAVTTRNTGDDSLGTDAAGVPNKVAIFRPAAAKYGQGGVTHPIIVWGNGSTNTVDIWQGFLARVATYGFVVVAPEQTQVTAEHMNKALDYVLKLANDPASGDCGKIDTSKLGATGYSRGGGGAISVGSNERIKATFIFASNGNVRNLKAPWAVVGGDMDTIFDWTAISAAVSGSTQPAFGAALAGVDHNRVAGNAKAQEAYVGWMRWRFMNDPAGRALFVGADCKVCTDTAFSGVLKTPTLDSL